MFRKMRGIKMPYIKQGKIYFTCLNYSEEPPHVQQKINSLCLEVGGARHRALRDILTGAKSVRLASVDSAIAGKGISETTLYNLRREFYERW